MPPDQYKFQMATQESQSARQMLRDSFLIHHKGYKEHEGLTFERQNSCKSVKFVAQHGLKGALSRSRSRTIASMTTQVSAAGLESSSERSNSPR